MYTSLILVIFVIMIMCALLTWVRDRSSYKAFLRTVSVLYVSALIYLTFVRGGRSNLASVSLKPPIYFLRAIQSGKYRAVTHRSLLNMLLFVPFGYLLPQILTVSARKKMAIAGWHIILCGFLSSLLIESCQFIFHRGVFELDDLVKNTMGTAVGWLIWKKISLMFKSNS